MKKLAGILAAFFSIAIIAGSAQALPVSLASVGGGRGCADSACSDPRLSWSVSQGGSGSGSLSLTASTLTFSITAASSTFLPTSGPSDNGVTSLAFTNVTYAGTASVFALGSGLYSIIGGTASVSGTQTPTGAGSAGAFNAASSLLSGTCFDNGALGVSCGIIFSPENDFNFSVNGATRYFTHTLNVTAVPEPATAALLAVGLLGFGLAGRRIRS